MQHNDLMGHASTDPRYGPGTFWQTPGPAENPGAASVVGVDVQREPWL